MEKKYYQAYDERYKTVHEKGLSWSSDSCTPIVMETIHKYNITPNDQLLEIGCGEGRDSKTVLENGYNLMATDISNEAIEYCKRVMPNYKNCFTVLDCLSNELNQTFNFIYGIAVIHGNYILPQSFNYRVRNICKELGLDFHNHCLRHTFTTNQIDHDVKPNMTKELVRHGDIRTTLNVYTHVKEDDKSKIIESVFSE